jgi:hypothetical protein
MSNLTKEVVQEVFDSLGIEHANIDEAILAGDREETLLDMERISNLFQHHFLMGTDGTTASFSEDETLAPVLVGASAVAWGIRDIVMKQHTVNNRIIMKGENRESNSGYRTMEELQIAVCILKASKLGYYDCTNCPFRDHDCSIKKLDPEPWNWFPGKEGIALVDLPIEFRFVQSMHEGTYTKQFYQMYLPLAFEDMRTYNLKVIFVTHKATLRSVSDKVISYLDEIIDSMDERATVLVNKIADYVHAKTPSIGVLKELSRMLSTKNFFDFDLLEAWFSDLGTPSPVFSVEPTALNNLWDGLKHHYMTWGYKETSGGKSLYAPSCWVRLGYTPALSPEEAHLAMCIEMYLGKGHPISLTLAHVDCNLNKSQLVQVYTEQFNKDLPVKLRTGLNVKTMNKWRLLKNV